MRTGFQITQNVFWKIELFLSKIEEIWFVESKKIQKVSKCLILKSTGY